MVWTCVSDPLNSGLKTTLDEAPHSTDGPGVSLMFPPVYEGDEAGGVQAALCSGPALSRPGLQPRLLKAEPGWRPPAWVGPQEQADEIPSRLADALEVIPGEAEVEPADVQAGLLGALVKEGGGAAQQHVGHHAQAPQVRGQRHRLSKDQLWGGKLRAAQQRVTVVGTVELDSITKVCEFDRWLAAGAVNHQQVLRLENKITLSPLVLNTINQLQPPWMEYFDDWSLCKGKNFSTKSVLGLGMSK